MFIIGLSFGYHNSSVAVFENNKIIFAEQEERFTRVKNDNSFPMNSLKEALKFINDINKIEAVIYYENPIKKFDRILKSNLSLKNFKPNLIFDALDHWYKNKKFFPENEISSFLKISKNKIVCIEHHLSHASSTFLLSPYKDSLIVTLDGIGEWETSTISLGKDKNIKKISSTKYPHSLGLLYSAFTSFLGFEVNEGEYKVMGMAGYGNPIYYDDIRKLIKVKKDATFEIDQKMFDFSSNSKYPFNKNFVKAFGKPREPESEFNFKNIKHRNYCDLAASIQKVTEDVIIDIIKTGLKLVKSDNICIAGGVGLNSSANGRIIREVNNNLFVQPAAGDAGGAIGAALHYIHSKKGLKRKTLTTMQIGSSYSDQECLESIDSFYLKNFKFIPDSNILTNIVSQLLYEGKVIGWFRGKAEFGPRALGGRSILCDPRGKSTKDKINEKIKFREIFRPFAPVVIAEKAEKYFDIKHSINSFSPESYMLAIAKVKEKYWSVIPAVTHCDNTARVQTLFEIQNEVLYRLLEKFENLSKIPILLNTSFNLRGYPIVGKPIDAIETFLYSDIDILVLENYIIKK